jgi:hypothetical protein
MGEGVRCSLSRFCAQADVEEEEWSGGLRALMSSDVGCGSGLISPQTDKDVGRVT